MKRRIALGLALFHFTIIILHNIVSMADGRDAVSGNTDKTGFRNSVLSSMRQIIHHKSIHHYSRLSGTETGFGFFAPQVGSQYLSLFHIYDYKDALIASHTLPLLKQQESLHRYATFLDLFQQALDKENDHIDQRYARAILYSMGERLGLALKNAQKVECQILVFRYPKLHGMQEKPLGASLVPLFERTLFLDRDYD